MFEGQLWLTTTLHATPEGGEVKLNLGEGHQLFLSITQSEGATPLVVPIEQSTLDRFLEFKPDPSVLKERANSNNAFPKHRGNK